MAGNKNGSDDENSPYPKWDDLKKQLTFFVIALYGNEIRKPIHAGVDGNQFTATATAEERREEDSAETGASASAKKLKASVSDVAVNVKRPSMKKLLNEEYGRSLLQVAVSGDGSWKKPGFSSLYGVTTLIGYHSGKVIVVKSRYCQA
ncbi:hypothetical protein J437_LFUL005831 [Ladona fulva]|uniref:Mutator-like transposase domain-containing protein n=1 Tax=Ladona fulva TaxID=123851 RepID=A0A8K0KFP9_LADFU|nr:hypothetical protein J437_LFUL005831 [Ladona fulva]